MAKVRFDQSLPELVRVVSEELGEDVLELCVFLRDATGYLSVVIDRDLPEATIEKLSEAVKARLGAYARDDASVRDRSGPGAARLLGALDIANVKFQGSTIRLIDRRMVGADWLLPPVPTAQTTRISFASIKGGVGRSTALTVLAAHLSSRGKRVLTIDLDLEAPGIGSMLLGAKLLPEYGTLDYLVENGISQIDNDFLANVLADSPLGGDGGRIAVVPAFGQATLKHPAGGLAKIARAYLEDVTPGGVQSLTEQVREMIERLESSGAFDVILVDARAGLHETTAAVLLGLGAETLLFGIDEPQTFQGYRLLFAHLATRNPPGLDDWRARLQFVHAKAGATTKEQAEAASRFRDLLSVFKQPALVVQETAQLTADDFDVDWGDDENVVDDVLSDDTPVIAILDDSHYGRFNPLAKPELLTAELFTTTFGSLLEWAETVVFGGDQ